MQFMIVPIEDVDLDSLRALAEHASGDAVAAVEAIRHGIEKLTPAQRKASKFPSPDQLRAAVRATGKAHSFDVWDGGGKTAFDMSITSKKKKSLTVCLYARRSYYCTGHEALLGLLAAEVAKLAGPQVTFAAEDELHVDITKLYVAGPATNR
jgi:hypothetical protein